MVLIKKKPWYYQIVLSNVETNKSRDILIKKVELEQTDKHQEVLKQMREYITLEEAPVLLHKQSENMETYNLIVA